MLECDVLVVGAGPAGASAAYFCTQFSDKKVILLERLNKGKFLDTIEF
jgi:flavin-dependent dehydrogenase